MDLADRIFRLHNILKNARYPVARSTLEDRLECSRATVTRIIRNMKDYLGAPIEFDKKYSGYHYSGDDAGSYELPGLWFNASELHALMTVQQLLAKVQPGLLESHISPLRSRIEAILKTRHLGSGEVEKRVRILVMAARRYDPEHFKTVAGAVLQRKRLVVTYHSRGSDETTERVISPQRIVHYRDNWYLDAWDHGKKALRSFSIDRIKKAQILHKSARDIDDKILDEHYATAYGIFAGRPTQTAILRFTPHRARWVADEVWHPRQEGCFKEGCYELKIPYSDERELIMDILRQGPEVEVIAPASLRAAIRTNLDKALAQYRDAGRS